MWCNKHGTDGHVPARYTRYLHPDGADHPAFLELIEAGLWAPCDDGYQLVGWANDLHQSTAAEVEKYKESARQRQRAYRERQKSTTDSSRGSTPVGGTEGKENRDVTRHDVGDITAGVGEGSGFQGTSESPSAYVSRDVTRHPEKERATGSPFCPEHPLGTGRPCGACARARVAYTASTSQPFRPTHGRGWDCSVDGHKYVTDGSCAACEIAPSRRAS